MYTELIDAETATYNEELRLQNSPTEKDFKAYANNALRVSAEYKKLKSMSSVVTLVGSSEMSSVMYRLIVAHLTYEGAVNFQMAVRKGSESQQAAAYSESTLQAGNVLAVETDLINQARIDVGNP